MSQAIATELVNFNALENEPSAERKNELARHVATLFSLTSETCSREQMDIYDSVLVRLADLVESQARAYIAERLAPLRRAPEETVRKLANDEIDIARPLLEQSTVLRDADLAEIAQRQTQDHLVAIAGREILSEIVTDVLVDRGEKQVKRKVAGNEGATFSRKSMIDLMKSAANDDHLQISLGQRQDMPEELINKLVSEASETVRQRLVEQGAVKDAGKLPQAAQIAAQRLSNDYWLGRYDFETAVGRIYAMARSGQLDELALQRFAAEDRFPEVVASFAYLADVGLEEAKHWLVRADTDPFIIVSKAMGLSLMTVQSILIVGPWRHRLTKETRAKALNRFQSLKPHVSKKMFDMWKSRVNS